MKIVDMYEGDEVHNGSSQIEVLRIDEVTRHSINQKNIANIKMKKVNVAYKFLDDLNKFTEKQHDDNLCVPRFMVSQLQNLDLFKKLTLKKLLDQFKKLYINCREGINTNEIIICAKKFGKKCCISLCFISIV
jgi:hypothetical protein